MKLCQFLLVASEGYDGEGHADGSHDGEDHDGEGHDGGGHDEVDWDGYMSAKLSEYAHCLAHEAATVHGLLKTKGHC